MKSDRQWGKKWQQICSSVVELTLTRYAHLMSRWDIDG